MKKSIISLFILISFNSNAQTDMVTLLNFPVGGTWTSKNVKNDGKPNSFESFFMQFQSWSSKSSVVGNIYGIRNNGDTTQLMEVWNFMEGDGKSAYLVQRTTWGDKGIGNVKPYDGEHLDITFMTTTASGSTHFTRDIHYIISENEMKAVTYHKEAKNDEWELAGESIWRRTNKKYYE